MARKNAVKFLQFVSKDSSLQEKFKVKSLEELLFHAKNMAYEFTREELAFVMADMEFLIAENRGEKFDPLFSLWRTMWGKYYFMWVIEDVIGSLSNQELEKIASK